MLQINEIQDEIIFGTSNLSNFCYTDYSWYHTTKEMKNSIFDNCNDDNFEGSNVLFRNLRCDEKYNYYCERIRIIGEFLTKPIFTCSLKNKSDIISTLIYMQSMNNTPKLLFILPGYCNCIGASICSNMPNRILLVFETLCSELSNRYYTLLVDSLQLKNEQMNVDFGCLWFNFDVNKFQIARFVSGTSSRFFVGIVNVGIMFYSIKTLKHSEYFIKFKHIINIEMLPNVSQWLNESIVYLCSYNCSKTRNTHITIIASTCEEKVYVLIEFCYVFKSDTLTNVYWGVHKINDLFIVEDSSIEKISQRPFSSSNSIDVVHMEKNQFCVCKTNRKVNHDEIMILVPHHLQVIQFYFSNEKRSTNPVLFLPFFNYLLILNGNTVITFDFCLNHPCSAGPVFFMDINRIQCQSQIFLELLRINDNNCSNSVTIPFCQGNNRKLFLSFKNELELFDKVESFEEFIIMLHLNFYHLEKFNKPKEICEKILTMSEKLDENFKSHKIFEILENFLIEYTRKQVILSVQSDSQSDNSFGKWIELLIPNHNLPNLNLRKNQQYIGRYVDGFSIVDLEKFADNEIILPHAWYISNAFLSPAFFNSHIHKSNCDILDGSYNLNTSCESILRLYFRSFENDDEKLNCLKDVEYYGMFKRLKSFESFKSKKTGFFSRIKSAVKGMLFSEEINSKEEEFPLTILKEAQLMAIKSVKDFMIEKLTLFQSLEMDFSASTEDFNSSNFEKISKIFVEIFFKTLNFFWILNDEIYHNKEENVNKFNTYSLQLLRISKKYGIKDISSFISTNFIIESLDTLSTCSLSQFSLHNIFPPIFLSLSDSSLEDYLFMNLNKSSFHYLFLNYFYIEEQIYKKFLTRLKVHTDHMHLESVDRLVFYGLRCSLNGLIFNIRWDLQDMYFFNALSLGLPALESLIEIIQEEFLMSERAIIYFDTQKSFYPKDVKNIVENLFEAFYNVDDLFLEVCSLNSEFDC
eukprot:TRINITY_DN466_c0_g1_i1.p1 TRINITY_DN466_c0_g1~~TRINITY_DN466_c0_g1_i1.p1  ORF type:complete len:975 (+),score=242.67 TRINITY_DN466_c0_g1_i1:127-3051(+)